MHFIARAFTLGPVAASVSAFRILRGCPPFKGSFNVSVLDLYPESADWDPVHCKIYFGLLYNASVAVYDPYRQKLDEIITFPGITDNDDYTISGIDYDGLGSMYFAATSYTAIQSLTAVTGLPANFTDPNRIIRYDTNHRKIAWVSNLVPIQNHIFKRTGTRVTVFQDMAEDCKGNAYVIGSIGSVVVKIDPHGTPGIWYEPKNLTESLSSGGLVTIGDKLLINDRPGKGFLTFDTRQPKGKPVRVPAKGFPSDVAGLDGLVAPQKYDGKVLLWADDPFGTRVFGSNDGWTSAEYLGLVPIDGNLQVLGGATSDSFALGGTIYAVTEFFQAKRPITTMKGFQMVDVTDAVDRLVKVWQASCN